MNMRRPNWNTSTSMNSQQNFKDLIDNIAVGIIVLDRKWNITYINPMAEGMLHRPGTDLVGKMIWEEFPSAVGGRFFHAYHSAMQTQKVLHVQDHSAAMNKWVSASIYPSGEGLSIYFHDITEQKKAETAAQQSENKYRLLIDRITDGFIALDKDFNYIYANKKIGQMVHRDPETLVGKNVWKEFPEAVGSDTYHAFHRAMQEQQYISNIDYYAPLDLWQENRIYPSPNGLSIFIEDITEKKKAEEELKGINERFYYATRATSDIIWELNFETKQTMVHEGKEKFLGTSGPIDWQLFVRADYIAPDDRERVKESFANARNNPAIRKWEEEYRGITSDNQMVYIVNHAIFVRNEQGVAVRAIGAMRDITEKKKLELQLREQANLQQLQIIQTSLEAQERERSAIGQEIHDNVNQIVVATKLKLSVIWEGSEETRSIIAECIKSLDRVIYENRKLAHELVTPDMRKESLVEQLNFLTNSMLVSHGIRIRIMATAFDESVLDDQRKLSIYRIVQEHCTNIVKHARARTVIIELHTNDTRFEMVIVDDGQGMEQDKVRKGIGLKNMEGRLKLFDGSLSVETAPGNGFSLTISLPIGAQIGNE